MSRLWGDAVPLFSSTKGFTGHTLAAAGGIEAVYSALAIERGVIYPNLRFVQGEEEFAFEPQRELLRRDVRCVVSNSFGFGGNCSSLVFTKE